MSDKEAVTNQRERYSELAGMLKEKGSGTMKALNKIVAKFALQEGVNRYKAKAIVKLLEEAGLILLSKGNKTWRYNPKEEWEFFSINI